MGLTLAVAGLVALSLLAIGASLRSVPPASRDRVPPFRLALPWIAGAVTLVAAALAAIPDVPAIAAAGSWSTPRSRPRPCGGWPPWTGAAVG